MVTRHTFAGAHILTSAMLQAAAQDPYYAYDFGQDFPDDESVGAATVKSMPVISSSCKTPPEPRPRLQEAALAAPFEMPTVVILCGALRRIMPARAPHLRPLAPADTFGAAMCGQRGAPRQVAARRPPSMVATMITT